MRPGCGRAAPHGGNGAIPRHAIPHSNHLARARAGDPLTAREQEILGLLSAGNTLPDIATQLGIAPGTVKNHVTRVYTKIGAKNRVRAARYYLDHLAPPTEA